jgi:D-glycero-D-manno-heptose 1,7-bisphosphate phosphatase
MIKTPLRRVVLLDRDGTINLEKHYLSSPEQLELLPYASEGIQLMTEMGFATAVITNQSAVGRGYFGLDRLNLIHQRLQEMLADRGAALDAIYVCPHRPDEGCACRKPVPGLAWKAAEDFGAEPSQAFVIGDNVCDIEMGKRIGATTILVRTGYGAQLVTQALIEPDYAVDNLLEAAKLIRDLAAVKTWSHA